jgi:hypothetical protein|tara:strand:+ start:5593 stop:5811 length:219 start_codon:yes stop_codon:yes gene_type:complete
MEHKHLVDQLKQDRYFKDLYRKNTIDMDNYFAYSGKQEYNNKLVHLMPSYRKGKNIEINNDMTKYKLKNYKK